MGNFTGFCVPLVEIRQIQKTEGGAAEPHFFSDLPNSKKSTLSFSTLSHGVCSAAARYFSLHNIHTHA